MIYRYEISIVDISTLLKDIDINIDSDKDYLENIDIDIDIDKNNLEKIDINIDIDRDIFWVQNPFFSADLRPFLRAF